MDTNDGMKSHERFWIIMVMYLGKNNNINKNDNGTVTVLWYVQTKHKWSSSYILTFIQHTNNIEHTT